MTRRVLFVCLGNICRSPTAEGFFRHAVEQAGLSGRFTIDSAGTGAWHAGEKADARMRKAAQKRGVRLTSVARQVRSSDFVDFDHILAMDSDNLAALLAKAAPEHRAKIRLFRDYDDEGPGLDVPDPYYGGPEGFDEVCDIVERSCRRLLEEIGRDLR